MQFVNILFKKKNCIVDFFTSQWLHVGQVQVVTFYKYLWDLLQILFFSNLKKGMYWKTYTKSFVMLLCLKNQVLSHINSDTTIWCLHWKNVNKYNDLVKHNMFHINEFFMSWWKLMLWVLNMWKIGYMILNLIVLNM
jgi:hypothetical protein